jgi:hypothetical protein
MTTLHAVKHLREYPASTLDPQTLRNLRESIERERAEHFRVLATIEDVDARHDFAETFKEDMEALDWALTSINDELKRRMT